MLVECVVTYYARGVGAFLPIIYVKLGVLDIERVLQLL